MPTDPLFLSLTDIAIEKEWWRLHFWDMLQKGGKPGEEIFESHGDEAFADFVDQMDREAEAKEAAKRDDFEDYK